MVKAVRTTGWRPALPMKWQVHLPTLDKTRTALALLVDKWSSAMTKGEKVVAAITTVGPIRFRPTIPHRSLAAAIAARRRAWRISEFAQAYVRATDGALCRVQAGRAAAADPRD
jgi:hypothetical protein